MNEAAYSDTEKRYAKALKKLARDEGANWKHRHCLRLAREYAHARPERTREEWAAFVFVTETSGGAP